MSVCRLTSNNTTLVKKMDIQNKSHLKDSILLFSVVLIALFFCFWNLGARPFSEHDESIQATVAYNILKSGDFFNLSFDDDVYLEKPPLKIWLTTVSLYLFGTSNFVFRFWDGLAGVGLALLCFFFAKHTFSSCLAGLFSVLLLFSSKILLFNHVLRSATQDSFCVFFLTLALYLFWRFYTNCVALQEEDVKIKKITISLGVIFGFIFLLKSFIAFLPLFVIASFVLYLSVTKAPITRPFLKILLISSLICFAITACWHIPQFLADKHYTANLFEISRISEKYHHSSRSLLYFMSIYRSLALPFLITLFSQIWLFLNFIRNENRTTCFFLLCWGLGLLTIISCLNSQALHYIAPAIPALAIVGGGFIARLLITMKEIQIAPKSNVLTIHYCVCTVLLCLSTYSFVIPFTNGITKILRAKPLGTLHYDDITKFVNTVELQNKHPQLFILQPNKRAQPNIGERLYIKMMELDTTFSPDLKEAINRLQSNKPQIVMAKGAYGLELIRRFPQLTCVEYVQRPNYSRQEKGILITNQTISDLKQMKRCLRSKNEIFL